MSNEVSKLGKMDPAFAHLGVTRLGEGIPSAMPIIQYPSRAWTLRLRAERYPFTRADDGSPAASIDVIILGESEYISKTYYPDWDENSTSPPVCQSIKGDRPEPGVPEPQNEICATCPHNVFVQGKGRACKDQKRVAVLLMPAVTRRMTGTALEEPVLLNINPASLGSWGSYGRQLLDMGFPFPGAVVTRISWNPDMKKARGWQMEFRAMQKLTAKDAPMVLPHVKTPQTMRILGMGQEIIEDKPALPQPKPKPALAKPAAHEEPVEIEEIIPPKKTAPQAEQAAPAKTGGRGRPPGSKNKPKTNGQPAKRPVAAKEEPVEFDEEQAAADGTQAGQELAAEAEAEIDAGFAGEMEDLLSDQEVDEKLSEMMDKMMK